MALTGADYVIIGAVALQHQVHAFDIIYRRSRNLCGYRDCRGGVSRPQSAAVPPRRAAFASAPSASSVVAMGTRATGQKPTKSGRQLFSQTSPADRGGGREAGPRVADGADGADGMFESARIL